MAPSPDTSASTTCRTLATDPSCDRFTRATLPSAVTARLCYARSREAFTRGQPGQDFALLEAGDGGRSLTFCVADGVGSSYFGGFAASYLSRRLLPWLQALPVIPPECSSTASVLTRELADWAARAHRELPGVPEQVEGGAIVREVLQGLRDEYGSETVFLAGRLDFVPPPADTTSDPPAVLLLCWMGNVSAMLLRPGGERPFLAAADDDTARWSTGRRLRGEVRMVSYRVDGYDRLIVHTDGAGPLSGLIPSLDDDELQRRVADLRQSPASDDVTILDLSWGSNAVPVALPVPTPRTPDPAPAAEQDEPRG